MQKIGAFIVICLLLEVHVVWANDVQPPTITTYGTASINIVPNVMIWQLNVRNRGLELETVAAEHMRIVQDTLRIVEAAGIAKQDIQTTQMQFNENWEYRGPSALFQGYFASTNISFTLKDFAKHDDLWLGLAKFREASVQNVFFDLSERSKHQDDSRKKAIHEAERKARELAQILDCTIGQPLSIEEEPTGQPRPANILLERNAALSPEQAISPGTIPIQTQVKVIFQLNCP